jgi:hypothetical protein
MESEFGRVGWVTGGVQLGHLWLSSINIQAG